MCPIIVKSENMLTFWETKHPTFAGIVDFTIILKSTIVISLLRSENTGCSVTLSVVRLKSPFRDGVLRRGVEVLQRLKVFHFGVFDTVRIATGARFAEFLKTARQFAIGIF